ncbi:unnamed protein product [Paramecium octaurelia]|uniref:Uncharacterized protein n=1 Tax=Paramecium octaurelia TaxID=43137 RepID=A0A8S1W8G1_PAROT|nr:unnamed protein product [Paramecium octaurelia]
MGCQDRLLKSQIRWSFSNSQFNLLHSSDGNTLASGNEDKSIRLWQVETGQ